MQDVYLDKQQRVIKWVVLSQVPITPERAKGLQNKEYPVMGYGFNNFRCTQQADGQYKASWTCGATCE